MTVLIVVPPRQIGFRSGPAAISGSAKSSLNAYLSERYGDCLLCDRWRRLHCRRLVFGVCLVWWTTWTGASVVQRNTLGATASNRRQDRLTQGHSYSGVLLSVVVYSKLVLLLEYAVTSFGHN